MVPKHKNTNQLEEAIGGRLRSARLGIKMSQNELASRVGISLQQIQKYETGANRISASRLLLLGRVLSRSIEWLTSTASELLDNGNRKIATGNGQNDFIDRFMANPSGVDFARSFDTVNKDVQHCFTALAKAVAKQQETAGRVKRGKAPND